MLLKYIKTLFLFILICNSTLVVSQSVSGKVISKSNEAIPYATIQIGENHGVISNEEGSFSIDTQGFSEKDSVTISCLGFEKLSFILENFKSKEYILNDKINELSEVLITNKNLSVDSILYFVNANLHKNYKNHLNELKIFSRKTEFINGKSANFEIKKSTGFKRKQLKLFNDDFDKLETSLLNNKSKQYTEFVGDLKILDDTNAKLKVEKAIQLRDEKNNQSMESIADRGQEIVLKHLDKDKIYTVKSGLFKVSDSASLNKEEIKKSQDTIKTLKLAKKATFRQLNKSSFIHPDTKLDFVTSTNKYNYTIKDITYLNNEMIYIIDFSSKRSSALYSGTMYVANDNFAVIRADYSFHKNRVGDKFNLKLLLGVKYVEKNQKGIVVYKKDDDGYYYPSYLNEQIDRYFYVNRPVKFIENSNRSNKVAFNFEIEGTYKEKNELLILSREEIDNTLFNNYTEFDKIEYETPKVYDPSIWSDYNVLEPLNEMKNFKVDNQ